MPQVKLRTSHFMGRHGTVKCWTFFEGDAKVAEFFEVSHARAYARGRGFSPEQLEEIK